MGLVRPRRGPACGLGRVAPGRWRWRLGHAGLRGSGTHLLFGGNRSGEFNWRLAGVSYQQIAAEGGGIRGTVRATRGANFS
ncbi:MAG: hypothetical protein IPP58_07435 [Holophagaceae bacterium]|uniref:Uncharacterized protein n=1 Tax=Candidatus Geothrix skivensis TaxID=2954439 RepID=A0A9D7SHZ7_9BACT|nr:hypothetical protein [Candidatus Geothrix skivensis]